MGGRDCRFLVLRRSMGCQALPDPFENFTSSSRLVRKVTQNIPEMFPTCNRRLMPEDTMLHRFTLCPQAKMFGFDIFTNLSKIELHCHSDDHPKLTLCPLLFSLAFLNLYFASVCCQFSFRGKKEEEKSSYHFPNTNDCTDPRYGWLNLT